MDAAGLELLLHNVLLTALQEARPGDALTLEFPDADGSRAALALVTSASRSPITDMGSRERLASLAVALGAWLDISQDRVTLAFPVVPLEREASMSSARPARGEARDDLGGARQGDDRQPGAL